MKFYVDDCYEVVTEDEAKEQIFEMDSNCGYFDHWVNEHYTAMDILTDKTLTFEYLKKEYMKDCDPRNCEYYSVKISEKAAKAIAKEFLEKIDNK